MSNGYWVKGYPYVNSDRKDHKDDPVIHRVDTLAEAEFLKGQLAHGFILPWGEGDHLV